MLHRIIASDGALLHCLSVNRWPCVRFSRVLLMGCALLHLCCFYACVCLAVSSLMPGQDLTRVTIPTFFLEPRSLLERMADMLMHPELLLEAAAQADPVERMKGMVKWYLSGFHYKTTVRSYTAGSGER